MQHAVTLLALAIALAAAPCLAQSEAREAAAVAEPTRIVLVARPGMDELANRFVAELRSLRFDVVRAPDVELPPSASELEALAVAEHARAAVRVEALESSVDLWLVNPHSHEVVYRRVVSDRDPAVAVLRALEILRGALVELQALRPEPEPPAVVVEQRRPAPAPLPVPVPPDSSRWAVGAAGAVLLPHAGSHVGWAGLVAGRLRVARHFELEAEAVASVSSLSIVGSGGRAEVGVGALLLGASVVPWGDAWLSPSLGLGWGGLLLLTEGHAEPGYRAANDAHFAGLPHSRFGLALRLSRGVRLRAGVLAGFATPRPALLFAEERNSNWMNPLVIASLGLELWLR